MKVITKTVWCTLLAGILLFTVPGLRAQQAELLPPEQAFALVAWVEGNNLVAEYQIAPGYYMYRERFEFLVESNDITSSPAKLGPAIMRDGKIKTDEFFGDMEVYRQQIKIVLPILQGESRTGALQVKATGQGCADIGVCYPPLQQSLKIDLNSSARVLPVAYVRPSTQAENNNSSNNVALLQALLVDVTGDQSSDNSFSQTGESSALSALQALGDEIGLSDDDEIPHPDAAFVLSASLESNNMIQTAIQILPKTYLYREKIKIQLVNPDAQSLGEIVLPEGDSKFDEFLGQTEVYHDRVNIGIPIFAAAKSDANYVLSYQYQGCVEDRICYPPITKYLRVFPQSGLIDISDQKPANTGESTLKTKLAVQTAGSDLPVKVQAISEQGQFALLLENESLFIIVALFFIAGIGLTFTPCVFPMIPILSSIIAGQGDSITTRRAFTLSLVYVLAMAMTYAIVGAIVGFYGAEYNIQIWFQDPLILSIFAAIFVALSLSMFGFYEIQMPGFIQTRITAISNTQEGGTLIGVGLMGLFSAIIVGPCITAPLVGALLFISQTQDWQLGGLALFALGLGMGVPLLLIGTSAGKLLPRAGQWMDSVKSVFGIILLAVAIWLLERILPVAVTMILIASLLITSAIYLGALDTTSETTSGWKKLGKGLGIIFLITGVTYLIGASSGSNDLIQPMRGITANTANSQIQENHIKFRQVKGQEGLRLALADSVRQQRATMFDFYADWCISCKEMEKYAFTHPQVLRALDRVVTLQTDVTANDSIDTALMESLDIYGPPVILFFDERGDEIRHRRVVGEMSGEDFANHIIATFQN